MQLSPPRPNDLSPRLRAVALIMTAFFLLLLWRLVVWQLLPRSEARLSIGGHGIRSDRLPAERGRIVDRHGELLVGSRPVRDLVIIPQYVAEPAALQSAVAQLTALPRAELEARFRAIRSGPSYQAYPVLMDAPLDLVSRLLVWQDPWVFADTRYDLRGAAVRERFARFYPDGAVAPHLLGYLREINGDELAERRARLPGRFQAGDGIGAGGLEREWDLVLRGQDGFQEQLVDARGHVVSHEGRTPELRWQLPVRGATLQLTLDARVQRAARAAFGERSGAAIAIHPKTGAVLAMLSVPGYDLMQLTGTTRNATWQLLTGHPAIPLLDRSLRGAYPPGSTYKMVVAAAALAEHVVTPEEHISCSGGLRVGGRTFGCWRRGGHGAMKLREALTQSCDVYFYQLGLRLGPDRLARYATLFGLGRGTAIGLAHERTGLIPTTQWKRQRYGTEWNAGETLSIAIGQGYNLVTPLQAATMVATIANGGFLVTPYLVDQVIGGPADPVPVTTSSPGERVLAAADVAEIQAGLIGVVHGPGGTAGRLRALPYKIAGKTGTAQVVSLQQETSRHEHQDHAWFVAYAPYDDPQIAVAVLVEHGGHGGRAAAPIAADMIAAYFAPVVTAATATE